MPSIRSLLRPKSSAKLKGSSGEGVQASPSPGGTPAPSTGAPAVTTPAAPTPPASAHADTDTPLQVSQPSPTDAQPAAGAGAASLTDVPPSAAAPAIANAGVEAAGGTAAASPAAKDAQAQTIASLMAALAAERALRAEAEARVVAAEAATAAMATRAQEAEELNEGNAAMAAAMDELSVQLTATTSELMECHNTMSGLQANNDRLVVEVADLRSKCTSKDTFIRASKSDMSALRSMLDRTQALLEEARARETSLQHRITDLDAEREAAVAALQVADAAHAAAVQDLQHAHAAALQDVQHAHAAALEAAAREKQEALAQASARALDVLNETQNATSRQVVELMERSAAEAAEHSQQLRDVRHLLSSAQEQARQASEAAERANAQCAELERELATQQEVAARLEAVVKAKDAELANLDAQQRSALQSLRTYADGIMAVANEYDNSSSLVTSCKAVAETLHNLVHALPPSRPAPLAPAAATAEGGAQALDQPGSCAGASHGSASIVDEVVRVEVVPPRALQADALLQARVEEFEAPARSLATAQDHIIRLRTLVLELQRALAANRAAAEVHERELTTLRWRLVTAGIDLHNLTAHAAAATPYTSRIGGSSGGVSNSGSRLGAQYGYDDAGSRSLPATSPTPSLFPMSSASRIAQAFM